jgi:AcrR family transcriptional regulator
VSTKARPEKRPAERGDGRARRRYESPLRAQRAKETRASLLASASRLFTTNGWVGTGMREVAADAGVSTETVYSYFSSKRHLLEAVIDIAVVGDDRPLAVAERPEFTALAQGPRAERIAAAARLVTAVHQRTAAFARVVREAASSDDQIAEVLQATRKRQRRDVEAGVELIIGGKPTARDRDGAWAIVSPEVYLLLVDESGWAPRQYENWLSETLARLLHAGGTEEASP